MKEILKLIEAYWKFDEMQQPMSNWHDKQDLLEAVSQVKLCNIPHVSGSCIIMFQKKPLKNILFQSIEEARNYIKMQNSSRTFKEIKENVFVCSRYGTVYEIIELNYR
jgi:hypothetical protein